MRFHSLIERVERDTPWNDNFSHAGFFQLANNCCGDLGSYLNVLATSLCLVDNDMQNSEKPFQVGVIVTPNFNLAATMSFLDPMRAANYLEGSNLYSWDIVSEAGGACVASNGIEISTKALHEVAIVKSDVLIVSSSWTPEVHGSTKLKAVLQLAARQKVTIGSIDTGAFIVAKAGLLKDRKATVHYEHLDAFQELYPEVTCTEALFEFDGDRISCSGGGAATDFALHIIQGVHGIALANAAARYVFHAGMRKTGSPQNPQFHEPLGTTIPVKLRAAIKTMEQNLEVPLPMGEICEAADISQRQLNRLFAQYLRKTPQLYYRDIRLDRARGFVTQTSLAMAEIAIACGFSSQVHFSRAYKERFGLPPIKDRIEGRVPFEFRAWPMHRKRSKTM